MKIHWEFIAQSRFRRREGRAGRWRDGGAKIRKFGGGRKRVDFLSCPMSKYEHFGPPEAPGPFGGFSGPPSQGPTEGSREPRRGAGPAERRRRTRSVEGRRRVKRPEMSSPGDSQLRTPDAIRQDRLVGRRGVARRSSSSKRRRQERAVQESDALNSRPSRSSPTNS